MSRFGAEVLAAGYTAMPNLLLRHGPQLGLSTGELLLVQYIWQFWWGNQKPHPSVPLLARQMGKSERMVRYYLQALQQRGMLTIEERFGEAGDRLSNSYDFAPLIDAVVRQAGASGEPVPAELRTLTPPCNRLHTPPATACRSTLQAVAAEEHVPCQEIRKEESIELSMAQDEGMRLRSRSGEPPSQHVSAVDALAAPEPEPDPLMPDTGDSALSQLPAPHQAHHQPAYRALLGPITALGREFGDEAHPRVSASRAHNLLRQGALEPDAFVRLLGEAAELTRANRLGITRRRLADRRQNLMPYLFATLERLVTGEQAPSWESDAYDARQPRAAVAPSAAAREDASPLVDEPVAAAAAAPTADRALWGAVLRELRAVLTTDNYRTWLEPLRPLSLDGGVLHLGVPSAAHREFLERRLARRITEALAATGSASISVAYEVDVT